MKRVPFYIPLACTALLLACATDFTKKDSTDDGEEDTQEDTALDTATDSLPPDGPDGPDVPTDVETDGEPPPVECSVLNRRDFLYSDGTYGDGLGINAGCNTIAGVTLCKQPGIWVAPFYERVAVIHGGEEAIGGAGIRFVGQVIVPGTLDSLSFNPFTSAYGNFDDVHLFGASLARRTGNELLLFYTAGYRPEVMEPRVTNIEVLGVASEDGGVHMTHHTNRLISGGVPDTAGYVTSPGAVKSPVTGLYHIFFLMAQAASTEGPEPTTLMGGWLDDPWFGTFSSHTDFMPLIGEAEGTSYFFNRPDCLVSEVVVPWLFIEMAPTVTLRSGLTVLDVGTDVAAGYASPHTVDFTGTGTYTSNLAGVWTDFDSYAMAALSSRSAHTMVGIHPPYETNVAVAPGLMGATTVTASTFGEVNEPFIRDIELIDFNDSVILHDQLHSLFYHVQPFFHVTADEGLQVHIFLYRMDGMPAGPPFVYPTGHDLPPAFDATIHPVSGHIYLSWMHDTGSPEEMAPVPGWSIVEIACE